MHRERKPCACVLDLTCREAVWILILDASRLRRLLSRGEQREPEARWDYESRGVKREGPR